MAPSHYNLIPRLKKQLKSCHFSSDVEIIVATETWWDGNIFFEWIAQVRVIG